MPPGEAIDEQKRQKGQCNAEGVLSNAEGVLSNAEGVLSNAGK